MTWIGHIKLWAYHLLSTPTEFHNIRYFKFGIPLALAIKCSPPSAGSEVDALRFLNNCGLRLPVPRFVDTFVIDGKTYTIMSRLPGDLLREKHVSMSSEELNTVIDDLFGVMLSAGGRGMPSLVTFAGMLEGPFNDVLDCYVFLAAHLVFSRVELTEQYSKTCESLSADEIVYFHADLRSHNILVKDDRLSGIID
ncbi:hypothetical protein AMATHDRAFT_6235 [Amanita thiersii Skay4041]|uniref:Aminoglycoside phosphotransferase domain-containing protein n=1 Tax=Amanita thiersii Skay4041 TaxID=703135 RepID=A0A2A9NI45_9AGAR|nr:hypothetical protein AMATHDRAFT_6235 [Amanita thiersii Skay4041]